MPFPRQLPRWCKRSTAAVLPAGCSLLFCSYPTAPWLRPASTPTPVCLPVPLAVPHPGPALHRYPALLRPPDLPSVQSPGPAECQVPHLRQRHTWLTSTSSAASRAALRSDGRILLTLWRLPYTLLSLTLPRHAPTSPTTAPRHCHLYVWKHSRQQKDFHVCSMQTCRSRLDLPKLPHVCRIMRHSAACRQCSAWRARRLQHVPAAPERAFCLMIDLNFGPACYVNCTLKTNHKTLHASARVLVAEDSRNGPS